MILNGLTTSNPAASLSRETSPRFLRGVVYRDYHKKRNEPSTRITSCSLHFELAEQYESLQRLLNTNAWTTRMKKKKRRGKRKIISKYIHGFYISRKENSIEAQLSRIGNNRKIIQMTHSNEPLKLFKENSCLKLTSRWKIAVK